MVLKYTVPATLIDFQRGWPSTRLHPVEAVSASAGAVFSTPPEPSSPTTSSSPAAAAVAAGEEPPRLQYGPGQGDAGLRASLAAWLTEEYAPRAGPVGADRVAVTNGASNGLATILQKFADPGDGRTRAVWAVEPVYFLACPIFRDAGFVGPGRVRAVPEGKGDAGVDLAFLRAALREVEDEYRREAVREGRMSVEEDDAARLRKTPALGYPRIYRHVLYMVPTFSNPSGRTMGLAAREELVRLAREFDILLITDDVYDVLRWCPDGCAACDSGEGCDDEHHYQQHLVSPPRLVDVDRTLPGQTSFGNAVSNGSFSKIVAPGVRVGWAEGTPAFASTLARVGATVSGGNQAHLSSLIIGQMLTTGALQRHKNEVLIPTYKTRYRSLVSAIRKCLYPLGVRIVADGSQGPVGGFFLYILFPDDGPSMEDIVKVALELFNLRIALGEIFTVIDDTSESKLRPKTYVRGARLCWAWEEEDALVEGVERLAAVLTLLSKGN